MLVRVFFRLLGQGFLLWGGARDSTWGWSSVESTNAIFRHNIPFSSFFILFLSQVCNGSSVVVTPLLLSFYFRLQINLLLWLVYLWSYFVFLRLLIYLCQLIQLFCYNFLIWNFLFYLDLWVYASPLENNNLLVHHSQFILFRFDGVTCSCNMCGDLFHFSFDFC